MGAKKCCATCRHWKGIGEDDVADCAAPLPAWARQVLEDTDESMVQMAMAIGSEGGDCPCYRPASATGDGVPA